MRAIRTSGSMTTPPGQLVFHMFGALAEFERSLIRERTLAALAAARREGRIGSRRPKMQACDIEAAEAMLTDPRLRIATIARRFGVSVPTFYRYVPAARLTSGVRFARHKEAFQPLDGN
jgi:DNA invertase Pin-like site-specific DNA recombinase